MKDSSIPTAIVLGISIAGAMTSAAIYFGLRARAPLGDRTEAAVISVTAAGPPAAQAPRIDGSAATAEVTRQLEAARPRLVAQCWEPSVAKSAMPARSKLVFDLTFDAAGQESARGIKEDRETARSDVTFCVQTHAPQTSIVAQGSNVHINVPFTLP